MADLDVTDFTPGSWCSGRAWMDEDGEHVWVAHLCNGEVQATMLTNLHWRRVGDKVEASVSCSLCGFHAFPFVTAELRTLTAR